MFETILAPLDGSRLAAQAIPYVTELANAFDAAVTLLGICESEDNLQSEVFQASIERIAAEMRDKLTAPGARVKASVQTGRSPQGIIEYAEKNSPGIVVLTSHGSSGLAPWSLGSTVQKIIQAKLMIPVLLIKAKEDAPEGNGLFSRFLTPLDSSARSESVLPCVIELSGRFKSEVVLFRAIEEGHHVHSIGGLEYVRFLDQDIDTARSHSFEYLNEVASRFTVNQAVVRPAVRVGDAAREILKIAREEAPCIISMASHGHSGIEAWILGSITQKIIQSVDMPLLLVRT
jgi:nucleotide-binding universal stress UspA family protein